VGAFALLGMLGASPHSDLWAHFFGLLGGIGTSAVFHSLSSATGNALGIKGGYLWSLMGKTLGEGFETIGDPVPGIIERALERAGSSSLPALRG
jgi:hypothetical protein